MVNGGGGKEIRSSNERKEVIERQGESEERGREKNSWETMPKHCEVVGWGGVSCVYVTGQILYPSWHNKVERLEKPRSGILI